MTGGTAPAAGPSRAALPIAAAVLVLSLPVFARDLTGTSEHRYAAVADQMIWSGEWIAPRLGEELYLEKPPLPFWLFALPSLPAGRVTAVTARLASLAQAAAILLIVRALGRRLFDAETGNVAAVLLAGFPEFASHASLVRLDMPLALWTTAGTLLGVWRIQDRAAGGASAVLLGLSWGLGTITKGPLGILLPLGTLVLWRVALLDFRSILRLLHPLSLAAFVAVPAAWLLAAGLHAGWGYVRHIVVDEALGNIAGAAGEGAVSHPREWYYYTVHLPGWTAPLCLLLPWALLRCLPRRATRRDPAELLAPIWFLSSFAVFSAAAGKRGGYLVPAYPALALLVARALRAPEDEPLAAPVRGLRDLGVRLVGAALLLAGPGLIAWKNLFGDEPNLHPGLVLGASLALVPSGVWALRRLGTGIREAAPALAISCAAAVCLFQAVDCLLRNPADSERGIEALAAPIAPALDAGRPLRTLSFGKGEKLDRVSVNFYLRRPLRHLTNPEEIRRELRSPARPVLLANLAGLRRARELAGRPIRILAATHTSHDYVFAFEAVPADP